MPDNISPYVRSILIALVFFVVGRWMVIQMGDNGIWAIIILLVLFYAGWWLFFRRGKRNP
jgi:hypothetical protein